MDDLFSGLFFLCFAEKPSGYKCCRQLVLQPPGVRRWPWQWTTLTGHPESISSLVSHFFPTQYGQGMPRDKATWCYCLCHRVISVTITFDFLMSTSVFFYTVGWAFVALFLKRSWNQARFCLLCYIPFSKTHLQRWEYSCHSDRHLVGYTLGQSFLEGLDSTETTAFQNVCTVWLYKSTSRKWP